MTRFRDLFPAPKPIIGVIHLPALPGYPQSKGLDHAIEKALEDLAALESGGADGALVENEYDRPHRVLSAPETTACMTRVTRELVAAAGRCVVGIEILLNDPAASFAVAKAAGAKFIRTDYFVDPMERPEHGGAMHIDPEGLLVYRNRIDADDVLLLADIQVKYARMLVPRGLDESARLAFIHHADAAVVSGNATGEPPTGAELALAKRGAGALPILIGSGTDLGNAADLLRVADGAIVGTSLKQGELIAAEKVRALVDRVRGLAP
jgi:membrane complex biogenesis BtpA family protein